MESHQKKYWHLFCTQFVFMQNTWDTKSWNFIREVYMQRLREFQNHFQKPHFTFCSSKPQSCSTDVVFIWSPCVKVLNHWSKEAILQAKPLEQFQTNWQYGLSSRLDFTLCFGCSLIQFPSSAVNKKTQHFQNIRPTNESVQARWWEGKGGCQKAPQRSILVDTRVIPFPHCRTFFRNERIDTLLDKIKKLSSTNTYLPVSNTSQDL